MRKLKDALRLKFEGGLSHLRIATALGISKGVVTKYVGLAVAAGLDATSLAALDEAGLERRLLASPRPSETHAQADYGRIHQELGRKGVTLMLLWEEYCAQTSDEHSATNRIKPWRYSQFCENYRQFARRLKRSMRQVHRAGEKLFIDYAGPTVGLMVHGQEVGRANIFVAAMGVSGYCFAYATPAQTARDWLGATAQALTFYGGVPQTHRPRQPARLGYQGRPLRAAAHRQRAGLRASLRLQCAAGTRLSPAGQTESRIERFIGRALDPRTPAPASVRQRRGGQRRDRPLAGVAQPACLPEASRQPRERVRAARRSGPDGLADIALGVGRLQDGACAHQQSRRV
jgi:transposase